MDASVYVAGRRAEFRLPADAVLKPNMRLLNVGLVSGAAADAYNPLTGAYGIIESIQLFDGGQVLDQDLDFSRYAGLKNALHSNEDNTSNTNFLAKSELGYAAVGPSGFSVNGDDALFPRISTGPEMAFETNTVPGVGATDLQKEKQWAWLDLRACLGFLGQSVVVPTSLYQHLRIVINYKDVATLRREGIIEDTAKDFTYAQPFLCYETLEGDAAAQFAREYKGVSFNALETAVVNLPAQAAGGDQERSYNITGFDDKYVEKMMLINEPLNSATYRNGALTVGYGSQGSVAQSAQSLQLSINGRNIFPQNITGRMNRLAMTTDSWGLINISFGQNYKGVADEAQALSTECQNRVGDLDYTGFWIRNVVRDLKLTYKRTAINAEAKLHQALNLRLMGVIRKAVVAQDGSYRVMYV